MNVNNKEFEIYMDGEELVKVNGYEELEKYLNYLFDKLQHDGYKEVESSAAGWYVFVNYKKQKCHFIAYKNWTGFKDCNGKKIYDRDLLNDGNGNHVSINEYWNKDGEFYYRVNGSRELECHDYPITDMKFIKENKVTKIKDVFETFG